MSAKKKYKDTARAKGAAIAYRSSEAFASLRKLRKRNFILKMVIVAVALLECILMVAFASFSWIEYSSSLIIRGTNLPVEELRSYEMTVSSGKVDLHDFFDKVSYFQYAKASSPDGKTFYFPKFDTKVAASNSDKVVGGADSRQYRKGDTTDFNTSYYHIDMRLNNENGSSSQKYYLDDTITKMFTVSADATDDDTAAAIAAAEHCYRLSITQGDTTLIFGNDDTRTANDDEDTYYAADAQTVSNSDGLALVTNFHDKSDYAYADNLKTKEPICEVGIEETAEISFRVWFEMNDPAYIALTPVQKAKLYDTRVDVNFALKNAQSDVRSYLFEDYSMATADAYDTYINDRTNFDSHARMYLAYNKTREYSDLNDDGYVTVPSATVYIPLVPTNASDDEHIVWRTAFYNSDTGALKASDMITKTMLDDMKAGTNYNNCYFFYGTITGSPTVTGGIISGGTVTVNKKWAMNSAPTPTDADMYVYMAYGVTDNADYDAAGCYGMWHGAGTTNDPVRILFRDMMASTGGDDYNIGGYQPLSAYASLSASNRPLYLSTQSSVSSSNANKTVRMRYDSNEDLFVGYLPANVTNSAIYFYDIAGTYGTATISDNDNDYYHNVKFSAPARPAVLEEAADPIYTAYGYSAAAGISSAAGATGYGTWGELSRINLSTELVDADMSADDRYRITYTSGGTSYAYYMAGEDPFTMFAYVPSSVVEADTALGFTRANVDTLGTTASTWSASAHGDSDTFYPVDLASAATGYWRIAVLVDGTRDNLINTILEENGGTKGPAKLGYRYDASTNTTTDDQFISMNKIDSYRWYVPNLSSTASSVYYRFVAYLASQEDDEGHLLGYTDTRFTILHDFSADSGNIHYYTITESIAPAVVPEPEEPEEPEEP